MRAGCAAISPRALDGSASTSRTDRLGNLIATLAGDEAAPSVMLFAHMDQLGFIVRKIEANGLVRVERLGGVPERALASQAGAFFHRRRRGCARRHRQQEPSRDDAGREVQGRALPGYLHRCRLLELPRQLLAAGIDVGTPIVYAPKVIDSREAASPAPRSMIVPAARSCSRWRAR